MVGQHVTPCTDRVKPFEDIMFSASDITNKRNSNSNMFAGHSAPYVLITASLRARHKP